MTDRLLVIIPSRGRPDFIRQLWENWQETTDGNADLLVAIDDDDPVKQDYLDLIDSYSNDDAEPVLTCFPRNGFAQRLSQEAMFNLTHTAIASWGDDHWPRSEGWDTAILRAFDDYGSGFVYTNDLNQGEALATACAVSTDVISALGYMVPPGLDHLYIDNVWMELGRATNSLTYLPDVIVEHMHWSANKSEKDQTYEEGTSDEVWDHDEAAFHEYMSNQFHDDVARIKILLEGKAP